MYLSLVKTNKTKVVPYLRLQFLNTRAQRIEVRPQQEIVTGMAIGALLACQGTSLRTNTTLAP